MTELAQLEEFILLHYAHGFVYYTERVTEQVNFPALLISGYTIDTTLTQLQPLPYTKSGKFPPRIPKSSLFG